LGGGRLALSRSADKLYNEFIPEDQVTVRRILLKMVQPTEGLEVTSSRISRQSLYGEGEAKDRIDRVLQKLIEARLVKLTEAEQSVDIQVEVAHEALVRNWLLLVEWLEDERVSQRIRRQVNLEEESKQTKEEKLAARQHEWLEVKRGQQKGLQKNQDLCRKIGFIGFITISLFAIFTYLQKDNSVTLPSLIAKISVTPDVKKPDVKKPDVKKPDVKKPDVKKPDVKLMVKSDGKVVGIMTSNKTIVMHDRKLEQITTNNGAIEVFQQLDNGRIEAIPHLRGPLISIKFSQDGKTITGKDKDGKYQIWKLDNQSISSVANLSVKLDVKLMVKSDIKLMVKSDGEAISIITSNGTTVSFMPDRKLKKITTKNGTISIVRELYNHIIKFNDIILQRLDSQSIEFSQDGKTITGKNKDGKYQTWKLDNQSISNP
jgi:hypothetical protein